MTLSVRDQGVGGSNPLSPTIFSMVANMQVRQSGMAQVPLCRKVRQYWVSRRILDATLSTIISTVRRDDPALHPDSQTGSAPILFDLTVDWYFGEDRVNGLPPFAEGRERLASPWRSVAEMATLDAGGTPASGFVREFRTRGIEGRGMFRRGDRAAGRPQGPAFFLVPVRRRSAEDRELRRAMARAACAVRTACGTVSYHPMKRSTRRLTR